MMQNKNWISTLVVGGIALSAVAGLKTPMAQAAPAKATPHSTKPAVKPKITATQAQQAALKKFPGRIVGKTILENEEGKWQYAVMVQSGQTLREVMVGAYSGKVEDVEVTTAAKEQTEAKAEKAAAKAAAKGAPHKPATKKSEESEEDEKNEGKEAAEAHEKTGKK